MTWNSGRGGKPGRRL